MVNKPKHSVGVSKKRVDFYGKVTGEAKYTDDYDFGPGLFHAKLVRSPYAHAKILSIDTSIAESLPGVKAVITGIGLEERIGLYLVDRPIFPSDRVRYYGEPVAGVVATSEEIAEKAVDLVIVEYEELPAVFDPIESAKPESILIHPELGEYKVANFIHPIPGTNISEHFKLRKGDIDEAWKNSMYKVSGTFRLPQIQHVPLETHIGISLWEISNEVTLWTSSQSPFAKRDMISKCLGIPHGKMRVIAPYVGGGFGGKAGVSIELYIVFLSKFVKGHPVRLKMTREEEFFSTTTRQTIVSNISLGCDRDGNLIAMEVEYNFGGGAYNDYGVNIVRAAGYSCTGPYDVANVKCDSLCMYTNHPIGSAMRGFGMPEIHWGLEQIIDQMAEKIGLDPIEFRLRNCVRTGDEIASGMNMTPINLEACIEKVKNAIQWDKKIEPTVPNRKRGKGIAIMWKAPAMPPNAGSAAIVKFNEDATVNVEVGGQELGQGSFTVAAQIAAEVLGVPYDNVQVSSPIDTKYSPYEWQTVASRLTWSMGNAVRAAAIDARTQILENVAEYWEEEIDDLTIQDGIVISFKSEREQPLDRMVIFGLPDDNFEGWIGGPVVGRGQFMPKYVSGLDPETGQGTRAVVHYTVGAQAVDLEVDTITGEIEIKKIASVYDVGKAINPDLILAQIEGGAVHGLSSVYESLKFNNQGMMINPSFVDYRIASFVDIPQEIEGGIVETPIEDGPWGARGVGEHVMVQTAPAISNALYDAIGVRFYDLPLSAENVYLSYQEKQDTKTI